MLLIIKPLINFSELAAGKMSRLLILHLVSFWVAGSTSLKVFSFEKTQGASGQVTQEASDSSSSLSFATLDSKTSEDLPPRFFFSKASKQKRGKEYKILYP